MNTIAEMKKYKVYIDDLPKVYKLEISNGKIVTTSIYDFKEQKGNDTDIGKKGFIANCKDTIKALFKKRPEEFEKVYKILTDSEMKKYCIYLKTCKGNC